MKFFIDLILIQGEFLMQFKIVSINASSDGNIGQIISSIHKRAESLGYKTFFAFPKAKSNSFKHNQILIGGRISRNIHRILYYFFGYGEIYSILSTFLFCIKLNKIKPNIIHLHNLHSNFINLKYLISFIKKNKIKVVYTFHDCWPITGKCTHFEGVGCEKWKTNCNNCPALNLYPITLSDKSSFLHKYKIDTFNSLDKIYITTPSFWLNRIVTQSLLKNYSIETIENFIDLTIFFPRKSDLKFKLGIDQKYVILCVAGNLTVNKGIDIIIDLAKSLDSNSVVLLVGHLDKFFKNTLPRNIIHIGIIKDRNKLAEIYSVSNVFLNPTKEETFGLVNIEALACGVPVITSNAGGSSESIDKTTGIIVKDFKSESYLKAINQLKLNPLNQIDCINRAKKFDSTTVLDKYINLYKRIL
jgi:putative colanic acid biosynthesis glycosyltransferase